MGGGWEGAALLTSKPFSPSKTYSHIPTSPSLSWSLSVACSESSWANTCRPLPQARAGTFWGGIQPNAQGLGDAGGRPPWGDVTRGPSPPGLAPDNPSSSVGCLPHPGPHRGPRPCHLALWAQQDNEGAVTGGFVFSGGSPLPFEEGSGISSPSSPLQNRPTPTKLKFHKDRRPGKEKATPQARHKF